MPALRRVAMTCGSLTSRLTARHQAGAYNSQQVWSADNAIDLRGFWPVNWDVTCAACVSPWWRCPALVRHVAGVDRLE